MTDVACHRIKLKPGSMSRVREWARELSRRRPEALATLADEGVRVESVFLEHAPDGDFLIYYMRAENLERSRDVAAQSPHAIDQYHQAFKRDTWDGGARLELLIDLEHHGD